MIFGPYMCETDQIWLPFGATKHFQKLEMQNRRRIDNMIGSHGSAIQKRKCHRNLGSVNGDQAGYVSAVIERHVFLANLHCSGDCRGISHQYAQHGH